MLILHLTHPVCLPGVEARMQTGAHAWLAEAKSSRAVAGAPPQSHTRVASWLEPGNVSASCCPDVTRCQAVGNRGLCLVLPALNGAGAGPSAQPREKQGESLINEGTARWIPKP